MRGHVIKRYNNSYSIVLNLGKDPATGKRKQQWVSVKGTKKDAEKKLAELIHQLDTGIFVKPDKVTVKDYLEQWLETYCKPNLTPRTTEGYMYVVRSHIVPALGLLPLTGLKPEHLQRLYSDKLSSGRLDGKQGGLSNRSVRYIHTTIHKALKSAVKIGVIPRNVADAVDVPKTKRHEMNIMNETEIHLLLEYARSTPHYTLFYLALFSGMRRSELLALRWSDVDLLSCEASVSRTLHQLKTGEVIVSQCKTDKSRRTVALTPSTVSALKEYKANQAKLREAVGKSLQENDYVFSHLDGSPLHPDSITQAWRKLAKRTGLRGIRLHDCRHTHASLMLKQGVHPKVVSERLGHASIQITLDTYSHVAPGLQQAAANRFDEILNPTPKNKVVEK